MFNRWPSSGGCSFSMSWVRPTAAWAMAEVVSETGPSSPMFSPAAVRCTPAAVSRSPIAGSPGHWWDRPQPPAMVRLCWDALWSRPDENVSAASPAWERAWLISASTSSAGPPCCPPDPPDPPGLPEPEPEPPEPEPPPEAGALAAPEGEPPGIEADGDAEVLGRGDFADPPGIRAIPMAPPEQARDEPDPVLAAPATLHRAEV